MPRRGFEPLTCPLGGDRAIHCATGANHNYAITTFQAQAFRITLSFLRFLPLGTAQQIQTI